MSLGLFIRTLNVGLPMSLYAPGDAFSKGKSNLGAEKTETTLIRGIQTHKVITLISIGDKNYGMIQSGKARLLLQLKKPTAKEILPIGLALGMDASPSLITVLWKGKMATSCVLLTMAKVPRVTLYTIVVVARGAHKQALLQET